MVYSAPGVVFAVREAVTKHASPAGSMAGQSWLMEKKEFETNPVTRAASVPLLSSKLEWVPSRSRVRSKVSFSGVNSSDGPSEPSPTSTPPLPVPGLVGPLPPGLVVGGLFLSCESGMRYSVRTSAAAATIGCRDVETIKSAQTTRRSMLEEFILKVQRAARRSLLASRCYGKYGVYIDSVKFYGAYNSFVRYL